MRRLEQALVTLVFVSIESVSHFEEYGIINKRCRLTVDCLSGRTQRQLQFYFLSNCSPIIVKQIEF
jgi:hypothetical protein